MDWVGWEGNLWGGFTLLRLIAFREYVESLHQNRTSALLYGYTSHSCPHPHPHPRPRLHLCLCPLPHLCLCPLPRPHPKTIPLHPVHLDLHHHHPLIVLRQEQCASRPIRLA